MITEILASNPDGISMVGLLGWARLRTSSDFHESRLEAALAALGPAVTVAGGFVRPSRGPDPRLVPATSGRSASSWPTRGAPDKGSAPAAPAQTTYWTRPARRSGRTRAGSLALLMGAALGIIVSFLVYVPAGAPDAAELTFVFGLFTVGAGVAFGMVMRTSTAAALAFIGEALLGLGIGAAIAFVLIFFTPLLATG